MDISRHLARVLGAVLLIAAFLAPSMANAHPGHAHSPPITADVAIALAALEHEDAGQPAAATVVRAEVASATPTLTGSASSDCKTHCCGSTAGMSCCTAALVPETLATPAFSSSPTFLLGRAAALLGLAPEALPKPPKSLA